MKRMDLIRDFETSGADENAVNLLIQVLANYEVTERNTSVVVYDDRNDKLLSRYIATKRIEGKSEKTIKRYNYIINRMFKALGVPAEEITTYHLRYYLSELKLNGLSDKTLDGMRRIYSSFFKWLNDEGLISNNPCGTLSSIKSKKEQKKPFSATDIELIKENCGSVRNLAIVDLLYSTGCRISELVSINKDNVDFNNRSIEVLGKGNKVRTVYLSEVAELHLKKYLLSRDDNCPALFVGRCGERLTDNAVRIMLKKIEKLSGVPNVHPHRFRRTLATNLLNRGMRIERVAEILGHEDLSTTRIYCYINKTDVRNDYMKYIA